MADRRLQVFHAVANTMSFTKAAEVLHMTQPAVTFQVKQLEEHFNTRLFDRTHNKISLTDAGKMVYKYAGQIIELYEQMEEDVKDLTGEVSGVLIIGASTTIAEYLLPKLLGAFKREYPDVNIRLHVGNTESVVAMVENNMIDLGLVEAPVNNKNLEIAICRYDEMVLVCPPDHPLARKKRVSINDMMKYPMVIREEGSGSRSVIDNYFKENGASINDFEIAMVIGSTEAIKSAVEENVGVSIISRSTLNKESALGSLVSVPLYPDLKRPYSHVRQKQKFRHRAVGELLQFAEQYCKVQARELGFEVPD